MTLGGMALAVGILVDDATVAIENIHRNLGQRQAVPAAPSSTAPQEIAVPAFVSTLCICIVFVPVALHHRRRAVALRAAGAWRSSSPMLTSYFLLADARADAGAPPARARGGGARAGHAASRASSGASSPRSTAPSTGCGRRTAGGSRWALAPRPVRRGVPAARRRLGRADPAPRPRLLPERRRRARSSSTCAARRAPASRRASGASPTSRTTIREAIPPARSRTMLDNIGHRRRAASTCRSARAR